MKLTACSRSMAGSRSRGCSWRGEGPAHARPLRSFRFRFGLWTPAACFQLSSRRLSIGPATVLWIVHESRYVVAFHLSLEVAVGQTIFESLETTRCAKVSRSQMVITLF